MLLQNTTILLKADGFIALDWREVFWGVWILISMLAGQVLVLSLLSLSNCDILMNGRNYRRRLTSDCKRCIFTVFAWASSTSLLIISVSLVVNLFKYLDNDQKARDELIKSFYYIQGWLGLVFSTLIVFKKPLR